MESRFALHFFFVAKPVLLFWQSGDCSWSVSLVGVLACGVETSLSSACWSRSLFA